MSEDPNRRQSPLFENLLTRTKPLLVHDIQSNNRVAGELSPLFRQLTRAFYRNPVASMPSKSSLTVLTWNNSGSPGVFERSVERFGVPVRVLGSKLPQFHKAFKVSLSCEELQRIETKYVLAADSFDVLCLVHPDLIVERFVQCFKVNALFNATKNHWPRETPTRTFEEGRSTGPFRFLNSGVWIGETEFLREILAEGLELRSAEPFDDQGIFKLLYRRHYPQLQIDSSCELIQPLQLLGRAPAEIYRVGDLEVAERAKSSEASVQ